MSQPQQKKLTKLDHTIPIYSPRTTYKNIRQNDENLLADLTLNFDPFTINVLKNEFDLHGWKMNITEFILVVKEHLLSWQTDIPNREVKLVRCLCNLFEEIDLNGNGVLEWDEFTNYVIEKATVLNNIKTKADEIKQYTKSPAKPISAAGKGINYKFNNLLTKIVYISHMDKLAFYEEGNNEVMFMNPDSGLMGMPNGKPLKVVPKPLIVKINSVKKDQDGRFKIEKKENVIDQKTSILDVLYVPDDKYQVLLTSSNDGYIRGWKYSTNGWTLATQPDNDEEVIEHHFANEIYCMAWNSQSETLYCGQKNGQINMWNFKTDTETPLECQNGHTMVIMDMIAMPKLQFLASAALDQKLILWETIHHEKKRTYMEHTRGIVSLAFNESLILLFSAGFDHEVCVWNPYIDSLIYKITGHSSPLQTVRVIEGTSQVITLDSDGVVKVTDIKKFNNVQTFSVETQDDKHKFSPQSFCFIPKPLKLAFCGRSVSLYEYDKNYNPNFVDDYVAICCLFVPSQLAFFTPAGNKIKIWNALTGDIRKIFSDITQGEITVFKLDALKKRMIIGDSMGHIALFNVVNGAKIKALPKHQAEITHIVHAYNQQGSNDDKISAFFLSTSMDNKIHMTLDNDFGENELIRTLELKDVVITSLSYEPSFKLIIVGTNNGITGLYESDTGKLNGTYSEISQHEEINTLILIPRASYFMITTCSIGKVNFIALNPLLYKYQKVFSFFNVDPELPGQTLSILNCQYSSQNDCLYMTDDKGYIKCYDVKPIIDILVEAQQKHDKGYQKSSFIPPRFDEIKDVQPVWCSKAHYEIVKSLEYVPEENLLITTAFDKKVKIWNAADGNLIDSFQQNYDKKDPRPIAFKRSGTEEIYDINLEDRIDLKAKRTTLSKNNNNKVGGAGGNMLGNDKTLAANSTPTHTNRPSFSQQAENEEQKAGGGDNGGVDQQQQQQNDKDFFFNLNFNKSVGEEFNPYYFLDKIEKTRINSLRSNPEWKLHVNFKKYYDDFETKISQLLEDITKKEKEVKEKAIKQGISNRRFKVTQFSNQDEQLKFDVDNKPVIDEKNGGGAENGQEEEKQVRQSQLRQKIKGRQGDQAEKDAHGMKQKAQSVAMFQTGFSTMTQKEVQQQKNQIWENLHRTEMKGKVLFGSHIQTVLSKEICKLAYDLASALTNYEADDHRSLRFIQCQPSKKSDESKNKNKNTHSSTKSII